MARPNYLVIYQQEDNVEQFAGRIPSAGHSVGYIESEEYIGCAGYVWKIAR